MHRRVACFAMSFADHFNGVMVVIEELVRAGAQVRVWTDRSFRSRLEAAGAEFADLFDPVPLDAVDDRSMPRSVRSVTFAGVRGADVAASAAEWKPDLVLHDSFALIGRVVAERLKLPRVIVSAGHAVHGATYRAGLLHDPRVSIDPKCWDAVAQLRDEHGLADASPFSYVSDPSPWLNICKEPAQWVSEAERKLLGPLAFFGSLPRDAMSRGAAVPSRDGLRIYAAFGTVIWRYWKAEAVQALAAIADAAASLSGATLSIGLGGAELGESLLHAIDRPGVSVHSFADQFAELRRSDLFITHHGLGSTHEAVACGVPMLSFPFFWDQPGLARRAQEIGVALPLIEGVAPGGRLEPQSVIAALDRIAPRREAMRQRLFEARQWEQRTIVGRPEIARQILSAGA